MCWLRCRYAWAAISEWQCHQGMTQGGRLSESPGQGPAPDRHAMRRSRSVACMTQLQAKQKYGYEAPSADSADSPTSPERYSNARIKPYTPLRTAIAGPLHMYLCSWGGLDILILSDRQPFTCLTSCCPHDYAGAAALFCFWL